MVICEAIADSYKRLLKPMVQRKIRSGLNKMAERASIEVFTSNLKHFLLTQPVRGTKVLGIDPGFINGCKTALISEQGQILQTFVIYPHTGKRSAAKEALIKAMREHNCSLIALGNGKGCRETEKFIDEIIKSGAFPENIRYSIVNERGASIYSCSTEARKEFPNIDPNLISAIYIARCLQDPLCEIVKVEPKHLGIGMYQHDISEKVLTKALKEVVIECVSFVGIDINVASAFLIRQVAGLSSTKAESIINYRNKIGTFKSRLQLQKVPGIGSKSFEQCAGFIRVMKETAPGVLVNPLDATWIHPESYGVANKFIEDCGTDVNKLGTAEFIQKISNTAIAINKDKVAKKLNTSLQQLSLIIEALCRNPKKDFRCDNNLHQPLFKDKVTNIKDLKCGQSVTGVVTNVTDFGSFVDIGVDSDALIHTSLYNGNIICLGNRVETSVQNIDINLNRIHLALIKIL